MMATKLVNMIANLLVASISISDPNVTSAISSATVNPMLARVPTTTTSHHDSAGFSVPLVNLETRKAPKVTPIG